jgi:hypothetical protein
MSHPPDNAVHRVRTTRLRAKRADHACLRRISSQNGTSTRRFLEMRWPIRRPHRSDSSIGKQFIEPRSGKDPSTSLLLGYEAISVLTSQDRYGYPVGFLWLA